MQKHRKPNETPVSLKIFSYLVMLGVVIITVYPLLWMIFGSLKSDAEFYSNIWGPPLNPVWQNYVDAWTKGDLGYKFINSFVVLAGSLGLVLPLTALASYAIAKLKFAGRNVIFAILLLGMMVPQGVTAIPIFSVVVKMGLLNTRLSLVLVFSAQAISFSVFLLQAFFRSLPDGIEEAALIDGCSRLGAFIRVILPLSLPGLATQIVFTGMQVWNEYFMSSILIRTQDLETLPLSVVDFTGRYATNFPQLFAALAITTLPVILLYILGQKQFISGMTAGALKDS
jgi:ABC-type glycerol-3-phosphate transport system permease component